MKRLFTLLMVSAVALGAAAQIPNPGFENWTQDSVLVNGVWKTIGNVERSTDKHSGNYALRLNNVDPFSFATSYKGIAANVDLTASGGQGIPSGGQPYTQQPDSFEGWFKYDLALGDTASIMFGLKSNGVPIAFNQVTFSGNSGGNFVRMAWEVNYFFPTNPDTMVIIMFSNDPDTDPNGDGYFIVDDLKFFSAGGPNTNIQGGGMENWVSKYYYKPNGWTSSNDILEIFGIVPNTFPVSRSTVVASGSYAFEGENILFGDGQLLPGVALSSNGFDEDVPGFEVNQRYVSLRGMYKYAPVNGDTATFNVRMFSNGAIVGEGTFKNTATVNSYTLFSIDITYDGSFSGTPDSGLITLSSASFDSAMGLGSKVWVDDIYLSMYTTSVRSITSNVTTTDVYPNPTSGNTFIKYEIKNTDLVTIKLYDITGKEIMTVFKDVVTAGSNTTSFNAADLKAGVYFYEITTSAGKLTNKLIVE